MTATIDEFVRQSPWTLRKIGTDRRPLLDKGDRISFVKVDSATVLLSAVNGAGFPVLPHRMVLRYSGDGKVSGHDFGRIVTFGIAAGGPKGVHLTYAADYDEPPWSQPDEGGDGDPK